MQYMYTTTGWEYHQLSHLGSENKVLFIEEKELLCIYVFSRRSCAKTLTRGGLTFKLHRVTIQR